MPRNNDEPKLEYLTLRVTKHTIRVESAVNFCVYMPEWFDRYTGNDPLFKFESELIIYGVPVYPKARTEDTYELKVSGRARRAGEQEQTLKDIQLRDKDGSPLFRSYRGKRIPVYERPKGFGRFEKVRGEPFWTTYLFAPPRTVSDMLTLLERRSELYVDLHLERHDRKRWITHYSLQTAAPSDD